MAYNPKALLLFLTVLVFSTSFALCYQDFDFDNSRRDPEERLQQCRQQCRQQQQRGQQQSMQCERRCEQQYQQERREQGESVDGNRDPARRQYEQCKQRCDRQREDEQQRRQCVSRCETQYEEQRREHGRQGNSHHRQEEREEEEEDEGQSEENNPFRFDRESFRDVVRSEHGRVSVLQNFIDKSKLFLGIANYRIAILEAKPLAFFTPHHVDADSLCFVARGWGSITHISQGMKETHNVQRGDILLVPAGCIVYLVNKDRNEKLVLIKLMNPVSTPGYFQVFHEAGGGHESIITSFSDEIVEASFNTHRERLERLFGRQRRARILRVSEEQVRSLSRHSSEGGHQWPFGESQSWGPFNLLKQRPIHSSRRGQLHEADGNDFTPLKRLDIQVSYANLSQSSMIAPFYNTRATKIAVILQGEGYIETICPHWSLKKHWQRREQGGEQEQEREQEQRHRSREGREREQEQEQRRGQGEQEQEQGRRQWYHNVRSQATTGTVVLIPPGHPTVIVASGSRNFEAVCFEINAERNVRNFLAGRNNILNKMDKEAKELAFGTPAREVDEMLQEQKEQMIVAGPEEREHDRRPLLPLLDFAAASK